MTSGIRAKFLQRELRVYKTVVASYMMSSTSMGRVYIPKPKEFKGTINAQDVENYIWGLKQYFKAMGVEELKRELLVYKTAVASDMMSSTSMGRVYIPKPKEFKGTINVQDIENYIWGLKQYFKAIGIMDRPVNKFNVQ
ncbi:hypothetical protein GQ457_13G011120 [Hibiscus cannabinus]